MGPTSLWPGDRPVLAEFLKELHEGSMVDDIVLIQYLSILPHLHGVQIC